ncbi:hypothetical protein [Streptomyces sp. Root369]|uniref:hypothetical protein n=1 Tax=Streptomyces sp. Root369 TaxID=1736523 RepID=UPI000AEC75D0|nr:hypothetical protein [Streptomyces sp. Root369]
MSYFVNDNGGWLSVSGDADVLAVIPEGYREVDEAEFNQAAGIIVLDPPDEGDQGDGNK